MIDIRKDKGIIIIVIIYFTLILPIIASYNGYIFDETWYISSSKLLIQERVNERPEHPPLAQIILSSGILILGDNQIGWRIFSTFFGAAAIILLYNLVYELSKNRTLAYSSAFLLTFDKLFFTFASLAVLDIFYLSFMLLSVYFFLKEKYFLSAFVLALSTNCKLTALLITPVLLLFYIYRKKLKIRSITQWPQLKNIIIWIISLIILIPILLFLFDKVYIGSTVTDLNFTNPLYHLKYMFKTHTSKFWLQDVGSKPWQWLIEPQNYYLGRVSIILIDYLESYNPLILGLSYISIPSNLYYMVKNRDPTSFLTATWFMLTYFIWFPISIIFSRPLFTFYILIFIPAICIINISFFGGDEKAIKLYLFLNIVYFMLFQYPFRMIFNF